MKGKWVLTEEDFENARILLEEERIEPLNKENMFRAAVYCMLSAAENYKKQKSVYRGLMEKGLDTPENILNPENRKKLKGVIGRARYPNRKEKRILKLASWWPNTDLPKRIIEDSNSNKERGKDIRNQLAEEAPGLGPKCASFFMVKCGYEDVVPADIWTTRFLKHGMGHDDVEVGDYRTSSGPKGKNYFVCEERVSAKAREYGVSPALFQAALWCKYSIWNKK